MKQSKFNYQLTEEVDSLQEIQFAIEQLKKYGVKYQVEMVESENNLKYVLRVNYEDKDRPHTKKLTEGELVV